MGSQCVLATGAGEEQHGTSPGGGGGLSHKISPLLSGLHRDFTLTSSSDCTAEPNHASLRACKSIFTASAGVESADKGRLECK